MRFVWTVTVTVFCLGVGTCSLSAAGLDEDAAALAEPEPPDQAIGQAAPDFTLARPAAPAPFVLIDDQKPLYPDRYDFKVSVTPASVLSVTGPVVPTPTPLSTALPSTAPPATQPASTAPSSTAPAAWATAQASAEFTRLPVSGQAMYYNPGVMQEVYAYRLHLGQVQPCSACVGYAALLRAGDINRRIWLQWEGGIVEGPFLVIDAAAGQHVDLLLSRNWVVDVDYETALRRDMAGPVPVTILAAPAAAQ